MELKAEQSAKGDDGLTAERKRADTVGLPEVSGIARV